jgi:hypothetical protein
VSCKKAVEAAIAAHLDKADHIDEQTRMLGRHERDIEEIAIFRHLCEDRLQLLFKHFEPGDFGAAQFGDHVRAFGILDTGAGVAWFSDREHVSRRRRY